MVTVQDHGDLEPRGSAALLAARQHHGADHTLPDGQTDVAHHSSGRNRNR